MNEPYRFSSTHVTGVNLLQKKAFSNNSLGRNPKESGGL
jgi:hypothetical protein